jgi:hypothetical protein
MTLVKIFIFNGIFFLFLNLLQFFFFFEQIKNITLCYNMRLIKSYVSLIYKLYYSKNSIEHLNVTSPYLKAKLSKFNFKF